MAKTLELVKDEGFCFTTSSQYASLNKKDYQQTYKILQAQHGSSFVCRLEYPSLFKMLLCSVSYYRLFPVETSGVVKALARNAVRES